MPVDQPCPKCGATFIDVKFDHDALFAQRLIHTCTRCTYRWTTPTKDAR